MTDTDVLVVGGGAAGLTAGLFTARAGLATTVLSHGESILRRNAHLENVPGFPAGVNSRLFLDMLRDQAERNDCAVEAGRVTRVDSGDPLSVRVEIGEEESTRTADHVVVASWADVDFLDHDGLDVGLTKRGSKTYVDADDGGRTGVDGLYAAGRVAEKPHQTVVAAGHGAEVALALVDDSEIPFYHDWVAPDGYFTGRGREIPPGCEEIGEGERERRERESMDAMQEYFSDPHPDEPTQHPSVETDD